MFVLILVLGMKQGVYTGTTDEPIRFSTHEECAVVAKAERERLRPLLHGEFMLYCTPDSVVNQQSTN